MKPRDIVVRKAAPTPPYLVLREMGGLVDVVELTGDGGLACASSRLFVKIGELPERMCVRDGSSRPILVALDSYS